jgi:hypothetical protein
LPSLITIWVAAIVAEAILYYFFLSQPYFRRFFTPFAVVVLVAVIVGTWRVARPRTGENRRQGDRRHAHRRAGE